jgi:hypothetical protein
LANKEEKIIQFNSAEAVQHDFRGLNEMKSVAEQALGRCTPSSRPAFVLLKDTLVAIDKYAPVIDVMIQQQPFIVNLVWGGIRFIISVSLADVIRFIETTSAWCFDYRGLGPLIRLTGPLLKL